MQHTLNATADCVESSLTRITEEALSLTGTQPKCDVTLWICPLIAHLKTDMIFLKIATQILEVVVSVAPVKRTITDLDIALAFAEQSLIG